MAAVRQLSCGGCSRTCTRKDNEWSGAGVQQNAAKGDPGRGGYQLMTSYAPGAHGGGNYTLEAADAPATADTCPPIARKLCLGSVVVLACSLAAAYELHARGLLRPRGLRTPWAAGGGPLPGGVAPEPPAVPRGAEGGAGSAPGLAPERQMEQPPPPSTRGAGVGAEAAGQAATTTPQPYDCLKDFLDWERLWPPKKQAYCCWQYEYGCLAAAPEVWASPSTQALAAPPPPPSEALQAEAAPALPPPPPRAAAAQGAPPAPPAASAASPARGASARAARLGGAAAQESEAVKRSRVQYLASRFGRPGSCRAALATVSRDCAACAACPLEEAGCQDPAPEASGSGVAPRPDVGEQRGADAVDLAAALLNCSAGDRRRGCQGGLTTNVMRTMNRTVSGRAIFLAASRGEVS
ncbi:unnamed protein product [Prorocentrum cordatum]|uniref:Uncharacterized protein n=1 Tax=Prorocentrum cordatum TaxID=2364126 RepID=A0ABN9YEQ2_9DINO|nr:unnamed protein product [Polarella glacialis]